MRTLAAFAKIALVVGVLIGGREPAFADTVTFQAPMVASPDFFPFTRGDAFLPTFDTSLGTLTELDLSFNGTLCCGTTLLYEPTSYLGLPTVPFQVTQLWWLEGPFQSPQIRGGFGDFVANDGLTTVVSYPEHTISGNSVDTNVSNILIQQATGQDPGHPGTIDFILVPMVAWIIIRRNTLTTVLPIPWRMAR